MADEPTGRYSLVLPFDTDDPEFARGVEIGVLWARLPYLVTEKTFTIHASNAEMAVRVCEARGIQFSAEPLNDDFLALTVRP